MTSHMISSLILWLALSLICVDAFLPWNPASEPKFLTKTSKFFASDVNEPTRSLASVLQELDRRGIRYPPDASRQELTRLLHNRNVKPVESEAPKFKAVFSNFQPRRPIQELLKELDDRGIQYPPRGSRAELERLLKYSEHGRPKSSRSKVSIETDELLEKRVEEVDPSARSPAASPKPKKDDRRNPPSTRSERLAFSARDRERRMTTSDNEVPRSKRVESDSTFPSRARENRGPRRPAAEPEDRMIRRQRRLQRQESTAAPLQSIFTKIPTVASKAVAETISPRVVQVGQRAANAAVRKVKKVSRDAVQFIVEEEDEGEDETPVQPERVVEVEPLPMGQKRTTNNGFSQPSETKSKDVDPSSRNSRRNTSGDKSDVFESNSSRKSTPPDPKRPIRDIIDDLNRAGIPYAASASRNELEELLSSVSEKKKPFEKETTAEFVPPSRSSPNDSQDANSATWGDLLTKTKTRVDNGRRKVSRRVPSFQSNDSEGDILDAIIEDYSRDDILIDVKTEAIPVDDTVKKARRVQYRNPSSAGYRSSNVNSSRSDRVASRRAASSHRPSRNPSGTRRPSSGASRSPLSGNHPLPPQLPPDFDEEDLSSDRYQPKEKQQGSRRSSGGKRRIYSPYVSENSEDDEYNEDSFDQFGVFGDFVANAADSFIWGPEEGDTKKTSTRRRRERPGQGDVPPGRDRRRVHWKDRMEMNFDYMMGIHEDGKVYNRWLEDELEGERTKRKRPKKGKKDVYERPLWEEEGSVLSMLFGNRSNSFLDGRSSSFNGSGSLVKLFRSLSKTFLILASGIARWASVRGALPQYVVVIGVAAAGLSAVPGHRLWTLGLTLIAMRTIGEVLHGYMLDDFESDSEDDIDEDEEGPIDDDDSE
jgi:hypothetical protein